MLSTVISISTIPKRGPRSIYHKTSRAQRTRITALFMRNKFERPAVGPSWFRCGGKISDNFNREPGVFTAFEEIWRTEDMIVPLETTESLLLNASNMGSSVRSWSQRRWPYRCGRQHGSCRQVPPGAPSGPHQACTTTFLTPKTKTPNNTKFTTSILSKSVPTLAIWLPGKLPSCTTPYTQGATTFARSFPSAMWWPQ